MTITNHQRSDTVENVHMETDITTCSHIEIDNSAFSDACKSYTHFSAIPLRKSQSRG